MPPDASLTPLEGGWSGETFLAEAYGERTVVRVYARSAARRGRLAPEVDAAVLSLVRGVVPVPPVLEVRCALEPTDAAPEPEPGLLVTGFLPGERGDLVLPRLAPADRGRLGGEWGRVAATVARVPVLARGWFADGTLRPHPWPGEAETVGGWVDHQLQRSRLARWPARLRAGLRAAARRADEVLDAADPGTACLVHGDLNAKNLLVDPGALATTGVLDWEFAHAGSPWTDLGNLLRWDRDEAFVDAALAGWSEACALVDPPTGVDLLALARSADLVALTELGGREGPGPLPDRARDLLTAVGEAGDPGATPAGWT